MNFIDHRISKRVSAEFRRVVQGRTDIINLDNGREIRNARWSQKKLQFTANYALLSRQAQEELASAFYAADAMLYLFRFKDHGDYKVINSPLAVEDGTKTPVQMTKRYSFGVMQHDRIIQAVVNYEVRDASNAIITGTMDDSLGIFTPDDDWPAGGVTWSGEFDVWVRFGSDDFDSTMHTLDIATADVELREQRATR